MFTPLSNVYLPISFRTVLRGPLTGKGTEVMIREELPYSPHHRLVPSSQGPFVHSESGKMNCQYS